MHIQHIKHCQAQIQLEPSTIRTIWKFIKALNSAISHTDVPGNDMYIGTALNTVFVGPGVISQFYFPITNCAKALIFDIQLDKFAIRLNNNP